MPAGVMMHTALTVSWEGPAPREAEMRGLTSSATPVSAKIVVRMSRPKAMPLM
jgi:hypothetical protein